MGAIEGRIETTVRSEKRNTSYYHWTLYDGDGLLGFGERDHKTYKGALDEFDRIVSAISKRGVKMPPKREKAI